jgi:Methyltransferase domain
MTNEASPILIWDDDLHLKINDVSFYLSFDTNELKAGYSVNDTFLLGKPRHMVEKSVEIGKQYKISKIFEMGILQGGSAALYDQIFAPKKLVAIEYDPKPVDVLAKYITNHNKVDIVKPYYGVNQADRSAMEKILFAEFPNRDIDLIVDDASHLYEETREAFNISFPYLKEGGLYIIEDWAWAHWSGDYWQKGQNTFLKGKVAMSNLLVELFMLTASHPEFIKDIFIDHNIIMIKRGKGVLPAGKFNIADHYLLRGKSFAAWL